MDDLLQYIRKNAIDLKEMHVYNFAYKKEDVLEILNMFLENNILVLGGDFIEKRNGRYIYTYINWSCDSKDVSNNIVESKNFIQKYADNNIFVKLVTEVDFYTKLKK